jgi:hypothetical protein
MTLAQTFDLLVIDHRLVIIGGDSPNRCEGIIRNCENRTR